MTKPASVEGMSLAPGVVETIISLAASDIDGVASVGSFARSGIRSMISPKPSTSGVTVTPKGDDKVEVELHIEVYYGFVLPEVANRVREAVATALKHQLGIDVVAVNILIDGIQFSS